ncbi:MAG TPA: peptidylprolyl isomerase [Actinomycetota bacterium]|nr:peptidylprolyl isomerase [Actinomycetota bacterium]
MTLPSPRPRALVLVLLAVVALAACDSGEQAAAEVAGAQISNEQLAADQQLFDFLTAISGSTCGQPAEDETQDAACARLTLTNLIQEELVKAYASQHDLSADPDTVANVIGQIEQSVGGAEALDQQLKQSDLTRARFEAFATRLLLFNSVQTAVGDDRVTDERVQQLYDENRSQYTTVEVAHILLPTRAEAEEVAREATPKNFADLAAERSQDAASAANGGSLGPTVEAAFVQQYDPTFASAALALQPGQISEPVQTQFGWHVIELLSREVAPLDQVREQITSQAAAEAFQSWMQERLQTAAIRVNPRYGRLDPATGQVVAVRSTNTGGGFQPTTAPTPSASP